MAFPTPAANATITEVTTAGDPLTVNLPGSIGAGDLLLMVARICASSINAISGWTKLTANTADGSDDSSEIWYRKADGSEGATVSVDLVGSSKGAFHVFRITGAEDPAVQAPEFAVATGTTGANLSCPALSPTGGAKDYLWIAWTGLDGETQSPGSIGDDRGGTVGWAGHDVAANSGTGGAAASNCRSSSSWTQRNIATEDPGTFAYAAASSGVTAFTIAVHPPAGGPLILENGFVDYSDPGVL